MQLRLAFVRVPRGSIDSGSRLLAICPRPRRDGTFRGRHTTTLGDSIACALVPQPTIGSSFAAGRYALNAVCAVPPRSWSDNGIDLAPSRYLPIALRNALARSARPD